MRRSAGVLLLACWLAPTVAGAVPVVEHVQVPSLDLDVRNGEALRVDALWFRPAGSEGRPLPVVIAMHGCAGMYQNVPARRERLTQRHRLMAELLVAEGYAVLFPDSFRSRGRDEVCTSREGQREIGASQRRLDILGALTWLQARADVSADRIALLGWSHGGMTLLATYNAADPAVRAYRAAAPATPYFRAAVAFYPGCNAFVGPRARFESAGPLVMFIAGSDDWTAPEPCIHLAKLASAAGAPVTHVVYPDTFHGFDGPDGAQRAHLDVPGGVHPGQGVTVAPNPVARDNAFRRMKAFLHDRLVP